MSTRPSMFLSLLSCALMIACNGKDEVDDTGSPADDTQPTGDDTDPGGGDDTEPPDSTPTGDAVVVVSGAVYLEVGESAELTATTVNGEDSSYTWSSSDDALATVDDGMVTARQPGEVYIYATGDSTGASGSVGLYLDVTTPHYDEWAGSAHADYTAEAFNHWNEDDPQEVPAECARCHSSYGFMDYIGADGTAEFSVESGHEIGSVIDCETCHTETANDLSTVIFPSGAELYDLGGEARCMTCHQGRESADSVNEALDEAGLTDDPDSISGDLDFLNIHYYPAAATLYAGEVRGGYQYEGQTYDYKFRHATGKQVCIECHDQHTLEVKVDECSECHDGTNTLDELKDVRMMSSLANDYDGDGDLEEGLYYEVEGLTGKLLEGLQTYGSDQGADICYDAHAYPYFFADTDGDGACSEDEAQYSNAYANWTARMLRAAYNYQMAVKDPGSFAHNGKYIIQLLFDSITDLNEVLSTPVDMSAAVRTDQGHFNGAGEAARHWDEDAELEASCSSCHGGAEGLHFYLQYGVGLQEEEQANGLECETCHVDAVDFALITVDSVTFASDVTLTSEGNPSNICGSCHRGRESGVDIEEAIAEGEEGALSFVNIHYAPAFATRAGTESQMGAEFDGNSYDGPWTGHLGGDECNDCHDAVETDHTFKATDNFDACSTCHPTASAPHDIRGEDRDGIDYDGDGDAAESLEGELEGMADAVLAAIRTASLSGTALCHSNDAYPYFFVDTDGSGVECDEDEATYSNRYQAFTGDMLRAAHNYQFAHVDHGAYAHNFNYIGQLLYDSLLTLSGPPGVAGKTRP
jgi:hypothetical protein